MIRPGAGSGALRMRPAAASDADAVVGLVNSAYRGESSKKGWTTEAEFLGGQRVDRDMVLGMIDGPDSRIELAFEEAGTLIGCVYLKREAGGSCYLGMLTVEPGRQTGGIGKRVLEHAEGLARQWDCGKMRMSVIHLREDLIAYYERRGYVRTGDTEPFPEDDPRFGLPKVRGLAFTVLAKSLG